MCVCVFLCGSTGAGVCLRVCSLNYSTWNAPPYHHLLPLWLHRIYLHYIVKDTIFGKKLLNIKCAVLFSLQLLFEKILIIRRIQRDIVINVKTCSCKTGF
jgi:hypothetical protein